MSAAISEWEASIQGLWDRFDTLDLEEGVAAMRELTDSCPAGDGRAAFELAGMYDSMGLEAEACGEYERALALGLDEARHAQLAVQYGSTLRNLGRLDDAIAVLSAAPTHESTGSAPRVVLALALHSAGRKDEALRVAIESQIENLPRYRRSMRNYAAALTAPPQAEAAEAPQNSLTPPDPTSSLELRPATASDIDWLVELRAVVLRDDLERLGVYDPKRVRQRLRDEFRPENTQIIMLDGADAGSISVREEADARWIEHFYITPTAQNRGIGTALLARVLAAGDPRPHRLNFLQGSAARRLYERHGFAVETEDDVDVWMIREVRRVF